ncbi:MAG: glycosyltransferase family 4 protein [bacterium]|nr:glycosyltransferase family 4 protein [bacterium]
MRILFIAPQPFFENRGTPIAVRNMLRALGELGHTADLVTYHAGQNVRIPGVTIYRSWRLPFKRIPIGFSFLKLLLDPLLYGAVLKRLLSKRYDVIHGVEEGIFLALLAFPRRKAIVCYDVDSSLTEQLAARGRLWRVIAPLLQSLEAWAVRKSDCLVPVCPALTEHVLKLAPGKPVFQIEDTPIIRHDALSPEQELRLRQKLSLQNEKTVVYIGNFEPYQGVDLILQAFAEVVTRLPESVLIMVGGSESEVREKKRLARAFGVEPHVRFTGFVPPEKAGVYLSLADVLVSPRCRGTNFPMKVYSYLASGKPLVATDLPVHTQLLTREIALLCPPTPRGLADGIIHPLENPSRANQIGRAAKRFVEKEFSEGAYRRKVAALYRWIGEEVSRRRGKDG